MSVSFPSKVGVFNIEGYYNLQQAAGLEKDKIIEGIEANLYAMEKSCYDFICLVHAPLMNLSLKALEDAAYTSCSSGSFSVLYNNSRYTHVKFDPAQYSADYPSIDITFKETTTGKCFFIALSFFSASYDLAETLEMFGDFKKQFSKKDLPVDQTTPVTFKINLLDVEEQEEYFEETIKLLEYKNSEAKSKQQYNILHVLRQNINTHVITQILGEDCFFETISQYASLIEPRKIYIALDPKEKYHWEEALMNNRGRKGFLEIERVRIAQFKCF